MLHVDFCKSFGCQQGSLNTFYVNWCLWWRKKNLCASGGPFSLHFEVFVLCRQPMTSGHRFLFNCFHGTFSAVVSEIIQKMEEKLRAECWKVNLHICVQNYDTKLLISWTKANYFEEDVDVSLETSLLRRISEEIIIGVFTELSNNLVLKENI